MQVINPLLLMRGPSSGGPLGDVVGPASSTDNAVVRWNSTTGHYIQNSAVTIADTTGAITLTTSPTANLVFFTLGSVFTVTWEHSNEKVTISKSIKSAVNVEAANYVIANSFNQVAGAVVPMTFALRANTNDYRWCQADLTRIMELEVDTSTLILYGTAGVTPGITLTPKTDAATTVLTVTSPTDGDYAFIADCGNNRWYTNKLIHVASANVECAAIVANIITPLSSSSLINKQYASQSWKVQKSDGTDYLEVDSDGYLTSAKTAYAEQYLAANGTAKTINTTQIWHLISGMSTGLSAIISLDAGETAAISAISGDGATATATSAGHSLSSGDVISVTGTTSYNGVYVVTGVAGDDFTFAHAQTASESGTFCKGSCFTVPKTGVYEVNWNLTAAVETASDDFRFGIFVNETVQSKGTITKMFMDDAFPEAISGGCLLGLTAADIISFGVYNNTGTGDITLSYLNFRIKKVI